MRVGVLALGPVRQGSGFGNAIPPLFVPPHATDCGRRSSTFRINPVTVASLDSRHPSFLRIPYPVLEDSREQERLWDNFDPASKLLGDRNDREDHPFK